MIETQTQPESGGLPVPIHHLVARTEIELLCQAVATVRDHGLTTREVLFGGFDGGLNLQDVARPRPLIQAFDRGQWDRFLTTSGEDRELGHSPLLRGVVAAQPCIGIYRRSDLIPKYLPEEIEEDEIKIENVYQPCHGDSTNDALVAVIEICQPPAITAHHLERTERRRRSLRRAVSGLLRPAA